MKRFLLCTDLDRTLIPNGPQPESPTAHKRFQDLVSLNEVTLAYVTGRHRALIEQAIAEFGLPQPDFAIADVGSTIYQIDSTGGWRQWDAWDEQIAPDWRGLTHDELHKFLSDFSALRLQEKEKQNRHKLSFYVALGMDTKQLLSEMEVQLGQAGIKANLIWSIDELAGIGLLDILPASANKLHAIHFLMQQRGFGREDTVFAGDSGNDLDVLLSDIPAVLVANADAEVRNQAAKAHKDAFYVARGNYLGMNGNYSAGILEGVAHYQPEVDAWLREQDQ
ncbi:MAG: HAD-IIB family hydrolase [Sulfurimicrobium sp.]|nr:HAD-IIB family hydrolase [Sulfurimicrobium sp.]MDP2199276.1 HAD-IIB family hydrolase [Sulfurimicrobium sp.]MDP2962259.1 HAD-IIB family hydrolase [Sulfurimicrobium sp.]MDP3688392.1 HAD-IIB family hydrolase [Sulfurimicrobium sp.]MDZ7657354.1 HAD-IIB family hydrolase [Sulfurimicrobium sp.]